MNILSVFDVLREGEAVANPATWKERSSIVLAISGLVIAVNHVFPLGIDQATADSFGVVVATLVGLWTNYATSKTVGLMPPKPVPTDASPSVVPDAAEQEAP